jgi:hypothetical protein
MEEVKQMEEVNSKSFGPYKAEWKYLTDEKEEKDCKVEVQFFKDGKETYRLVKNNYRTSYDKFMILEWFTLDGGKVVHIFNLEHSEIAVIDADTGEVLRRSYTFDMFIANYQLFDDREYLYLSGWVWSPFPSREIFHIPTLLTQDDVKGISIPTSKAEEETMNPPIDLFGFSNCAELLTNKDRYFNDKRAEEAADKFNKNGKECFLWSSIHPKNEDNAIIEITGSLRSDIMSMFENKLSKLYIKSIGNVSGNELHNDWAFYDISDRWINRENLTYYVFQIVGAPGFIKPMAIEYVNFRYEVHAIFEDKRCLQFKIQVFQHYKPTGTSNHDGPVFEPSSDMPLRLTFIRE